MDRGKRLALDALFWIGLVVGLLVLGLWGASFGPFQAVQRFLKEHRTSLLIVTLGTTAIGFSVFMGGTIYAILHRGRPMGHEEVEDLARSIRDTRAAPYVWRRSTYRIYGWTAGRAGGGEGSFRELKEAIRTGAWLREPGWRLFFLLVISGLVWMVGILAVSFVLAPATVRLIIAAAVAYATARTVWAYRTA
jgi:hypothetical protein